jgi:tRNA synthetase class II core domain (G, H, P, S and T)
VGLTLERIDVRRAGCSRRSLEVVSDLPARQQFDFDEEILVTGLIFSASWPNSVTVSRTGGGTGAQGNLRRDDLGLPRRIGSAGKDTRGLQCVHEFHKVELVRICTPDTVQDEFDALLADAERPLQLLELPYRVVDLCAGDLAFSSARIFDLEVYSPGVDRWLEVSSVGNFTDFQARRGNVRYRVAAGQTRPVNFLNGSALATPRMWAAIIEHGQRPDGTVELPAALVPYMGKKVMEPER